MTISSSEARARILGRLRRAAPAAPPEAPDVSAHYAARSAPTTLAERTRRFQTAIEAARAEVHRVTDGTLADTLCGIVQAKSLRNLLVGQRVLDDASLTAPLDRATRLVPYVGSVQTPRSTIFHDIDAGLSIARGAIAETGTLILWPDEREPRLLSLVPSVHFVLLDAALIHDSLHAVMSKEGWGQDLGASVLLISGPSKTADIQQTLAYGAHGPKELVVLVRVSPGEVG